MAFPNPFTKAYMDAAIEERPTRPMLQQGYIGQEYFPLTRVWDYQITWDLITSGNRLAGIYAHDGVPVPGQGFDYNSIVADIMHIMASRTVHPNVVYKLRQAGELSVSDAARQIRAQYLAKLGEDIAYCQDEVEAVIEYLCMQTLQGSITWPPKDADGNTISSPPASWGDISFTLSLGFPSDFSQNATTLVGANSRAGTQVIWSNESSSNPIKDLEVIRELYTENTGVSAWGSTVLMGSDVLSHIAFNANVLRWIRGDTGAPTEGMNKFIAQSALQDYLKTKMGYNLRIYDAQWTYPTSLDSTSGATENRVRFLPRGTVIIIPPGIMGNGLSYFATAPDMGAPNGENLGLYTWVSRMDEPPWTVNLGCGIHGFPIMKASSNVSPFVLDVLS